MSSFVAQNLVEVAESVLDGPASKDVAGRPGSELAERVLALHRLTRMLGAALLTATAAFDASGAWEADGAVSAAHVKVLTAAGEKNPERRESIGAAEPVLVEPRAGSIRLRSGRWWRTGPARWIRRPPQWPPHEARSV